MKSTPFLLPLGFSLACTSASDKPTLQTGNEMKTVRTAFTADFQTPYHYVNDTVLVKPHTRRGYGPLDAIGVVEIEVPAGMDAVEYAKLLMKTGEYEFAEPNVIASLSDIAEDMGDFEELGDELDMMNAALSSSGDPLGGYQWHMTSLGLDALPESAQGQGVTVAVIDSGVSTGGEDTPVNMLSGFDFHNNDSDPSDDNGHGTHVAGTIAQASFNAYGVRGVAPQANILPVKVLGGNGSGSFSSVAAGIIYAADQGADVINLSLGAHYNSATMNDAVQYAHNLGSVVVAATGNDGMDEGVAYPAAHDNVIAVGSVGFDNTRAYYSNGGAQIDFAAPGGDMRFDNNGDGYADGVLQETVVNGQWGYFFYQGTSMASPHGAGAIAALMSEGASGSEIIDALNQTANDSGTAGWDNLYGSGVIRADLAHAQLYPPAPEEPLTAMAVRNNHKRLQVRMWPVLTESVTLCLQKESGEEKCRSKSPRDLSNRGRGGQIGIGHVNDAGFDSYTLTVPTENGNYTYGPFSMPAETNHWEEEVSCEADLSVDNLVHRYRNLSPFGRVVIRFDLQQDLTLSMCGINKNGINNCNWNIRKAGNNRRFGVRLAEDQIDYTVTLRDAQGCHVKTDFTVPNTTHWSSAL